MSSQFVFNEAYYLSQYADVRAAVAAGLITAQAHWEQFGWREERNPNAQFNTAYYATNNPDVVAAQVNYLDHFLANGASEGRLPNSSWAGTDLTKFDSEAYYAANPDVKTAGMDALTHYMLHGQFEARTGAQLTDGTVITAPTADANAGQTFTLTTVVGETVRGTAGNDLFNAVVDVAGLGGTPPATLNAGDTVDGAAGVDTINLIAGSAAAVVAPNVIKNVEIVNLISDVPADSFVAGVANVANFAGVQQLWQKNGTASQDVTGVTNDVTVGFANTAIALNAGDVTAAAGVANNTVNVALESVANGGNLTIGEITVNGVKTVNVNGSVAGAGGLTIDLDTATVQGTGLAAEETLNLGLAAGTATAPGVIAVTSTTLKTIDASASTGHLNITAVATVETLKGGSGNDTLTGGAASKLIEGGAGADIITSGGVAGGVINGGANGTVSNVAAPGNVLYDAITLAGGAGVSETVLTEVGHSGLTAATIDQITGFTTAVDKLDFNLAAGSATNYLAGGASSGVTDALTNANTAFDGTVQYFETQVGADTLIFVDADLDGTADMAIQLMIVGVGGVAFGDIIA